MDKNTLKSMESRLKFSLSVTTEPNNKAIFESTLHTFYE